MIRKLIDLFHSISLRKQIALFFCATTIMSIFVILFYSFALYSHRKNIKTEESRNIIELTNTNLKQLAKQVSGAGSTLASNMNVQYFLMMEHEGKPETVLQRSELRDIILNSFEGIAEANDFIQDIAIITVDDEITSYGNYLNYSVYNSLDKDLIRTSTGSFFLPFAGNNSLLKKGFAYIMPVFRTIGFFSDSKERIGTCVILCRQEALDQILKNSAATHSSTVLITDRENRIIACNSQHPTDLLMASVGELFSIKDIPIMILCRPSISWEKNVICW